MKKVVYFLSSAIVAMFAFTGCGSDDDDSKENKDKVYNVKSITLNSLDYKEKVSFTYENNKLAKVSSMDDEDNYWEKLSYTSETSINVTDSDGDESVITMDASNNVIVKEEYSWYDEDEEEWNKETTEYDFNGGYLSSINRVGDHIVLLDWENGNISSYDDITFVYSNIKNNTNLDFAMLLADGGVSWQLMNQFIKNVSKNIPSSVKSGNAVGIITTTLDEKGRPSKMVFDGDTYTFEYYD